ncbi:hypothetical protein [Streptomyces kanasensis]|uniref:hypothetical protein n=1 Tax=Streptomyces kanasensis TaxID=936756 RepID=UPI0037FDBC62
MEWLTPRGVLVDKARSGKPDPGGTRDRYTERVQIVRRVEGDMAPKVYRAAALAALLAWSSVACNAGGDTASIDQARLVGPWTNEAGARLVFEADRRATGTELGSALPGSFSCPDSLSGTWSFYSAPTDEGFTAADASCSFNDELLRPVDPEPEQSQ